MRTPTEEQQAVVDSDARVRIVRAAPGSGKTWLVAELIRSELESWRGNGGGIAALSFTRVGGEEIRKALGYDLGHPHFVGTIDAFLFRYVVRPFLQRARANHAAPRLIPADWSPGYWTKGPGGGTWSHPRSGGTQGQSYNLLEVCFLDEDANGPALGCPRPFQGGTEPVTANDRAGLLAAKRQNWQRLGWLTHADVAFISSELLGDVTHGAAIRAILLRRFPLLVVDELQDTGYFLGKCIRLLLGEGNARGILVGDPDQAIFEFNGARPDLFSSFDRIQGAATLPLERSRRCPAAITSCASHVKDTSGQIEPNPKNIGRALLVRYADMVGDVRRLVGAIRCSRPTAIIKVIARHNKTTEELTSRSAKEAPTLHCPALNHSCRAARAFRQGHNVRALAGIRAALELIVFGHEGRADEELEASGIDPREWKALAVRCLLKCNDIAAATNLHEWQSEAGRVVDAQVAAFRLPTAITFQTGKIKPQKRKGWDTVVSEFLPTSGATAPTVAKVPVQTVHAIKGETHDVTVFVCPDSSRPGRCPSVVWWSTDAGHREERRIAYVAMTRTRSDLVLCVSDVCYRRLCQDRAAFVRTLHCKTVDECIAAFAATGNPLCHSEAGD